MQPNRRGNNNFRSPASAPLDAAVASVAAPSDHPFKSAVLFNLLIQPLFCIFSTALGFAFSRLLFFLLFSSSPSSPTHSSHHLFLRSPSSSSYFALPSPSPPLPPPSPPPSPPPPVAAASSHVVVGRHGILVRPWPHPNPTEVLRAHRIIARVQQEQRLQYGVKSPRNLLVVTPTYPRTFQTLHLTGIIHSLMLVPYPLTWLVVEAGGTSNETAALITQTHLPVLHLPFHEQMPDRWSDRHRLEARMRLHALRIIRQRKLDGIVVFADDSNVHSMELFDEIQKVKWMGAVSVGIIAHSSNPETTGQRPQNEDEKENAPVPVQGPACNSSGQLIGWHTFNSLPYVNKSATFVGDAVTVLPTKLEWAGFVLNSRLLWNQADDKPNWVRDLDEVGMNGEEFESPLDLLKDASSVEPLGNCGKKVMLWWLRVEARYDSKFPSGWVIDPPLEITVPAKRTPWPEAPPELPSQKKSINQGHPEKRASKAGKSPRPKRSSRTKRKREVRADTRSSEVSQRQAT